MRRFAAGLFAALAVALAGCGSDPKPPVTVEPYSYGPPGQFHEKAANAAPDQLPQRYTDANNNAVDLAAYRGKKNVILVVVKGLPPEVSGFCPGCLAQVSGLVANYEELRKRDAEVFVVFPGNKAKLPEYLKAAKVDGADGSPTVPFPLLLDPEMAAVLALGIPGQLAKPSTFILDKQGKVVFGYVGDPKDNYDRPSVRALLAQLDKLNAAP